MVDRNLKRSVKDLLKVFQPSGIDKSSPPSPSNQPTTAQKQSAVTQPTQTTPESNPSSSPMSQPMQEAQRTPEIKPSSSPMSQPMPEAQRTPESNPSSSPMSQPMPEAQRTPEINPSSSPMSQPMPEAQRTPESNPSSSPMSQPMPEAQSTPEINPSSSPTSQPMPEAQRTPEINPSSSPMSQPMPDAQRTPEINPSSSPMSQPMPDAQRTPEINPSSSYTSQPMPDAQRTPEINPSSSNTSQPMPDAQRTPEINPSSSPMSQPMPEAQRTPESTLSAPVRHMSQPIKDWEKPRLFIETDDEGELLVNEETKMCLEKIGEPVVVVSVVGLYRTGKSFLLNRLSCMGQGFELGSTVESKTKGIWIWVVPHPDRDDCLLVLLDTEGLGDMDKVKMDHDIWIFALGILLSGTFVYNSKGAIDQNAMNDLHCVTEVAERIKIKSVSDDDIGVNEKGRNPSTSSSGSKDDELKKFFPKFVWTLRDFTLEIEIKGKKDCTPDEYLEHALTPVIHKVPEQRQNLKDRTVRTRKAEPKEKATVAKLGHSAEPAVSDNQLDKPVHPKDCIKDYFPERKCFVFPIPVERTNQIKEINRLRDDELDKIFVQVVHEFCDYIFSKSEVKTVFGDITTGRALVRLAAIYVESIRNGNAPCIQNAVQSTAKIENEQAIKESVDLYTEKFKALAIFPKFKTLQEITDCHAKCSKETFEFFLKKSVFDSKRIYYQQLGVQIKEVYAGLSKDYEAKAVEACKTQLHELHKKIAAKDYIKSGGYISYETDMQELVDTYENTPHLKDVTARLLSDFKTSKEETRKLILKADVKLTQADKRKIDSKTDEDAKELAKKARKAEEKRHKLQEEETERSTKEHMARLEAQAEADRLIKRSYEVSDSGVYETLRRVAESIGSSKIMPWNWFS